MVKHDLIFQLLHWNPLLVIEKWEKLGTKTIEVLNIVTAAWKPLNPFQSLTKSLIRRETTETAPCVYHSQLESKKTGKHCKQTEEKKHGRMVITSFV